MKKSKKIYKVYDHPVRNFRLARRDLRIRKFNGASKKIKVKWPQNCSLDFLQTAYSAVSKIRFKYGAALTLLLIETILL